MECCGVLCVDEPDWAGDRDGERGLVHEADLSVRLLAGVRNDSAAGRDGGVASGAAVDKRRRDGAAVLLWVGLGGYGGAGVIAGDVEGASADAGGDCFEAGGICWGAGGDGGGGVSRSAAADSADCAGGVDGC